MTPGGGVRNTHMASDGSLNDIGTAPNDSLEKTAPFLYDGNTAVCGEKL